MLEKGKYRVRIMLDTFMDGTKEFYRVVGDAEKEFDVEDFLDVHHRGKVGQVIDDLRDELIREVFKSDYERTE